MKVKECQGEQKETMTLITETFGKEALNLTKEEFIQRLKALPFRDKKLKARLLAEWLKIKGLPPSKADFVKLETR